MECIDVLLIVAHSGSTVIGDGSTQSVKMIPLSWKWFWYCLRWLKQSKQLHCMFKWLISWRCPLQYKLTCTLRWHKHSKQLHCMFKWLISWRCPLQTEVHFGHPNSKFTEFWTVPDPDMWLWAYILSSDCGHDFSVLAQAESPTVTLLFFKKNKDFACKL